MVGVPAAGCGGLRAGSGLGLAIARQIVADHDGAIGVVASRLGVGTTFTITLPDGDATPRVTRETYRAWRLLLM